MRINCETRPGSDADKRNGKPQPHAWAARFMREEDGTVTMLAFFIFVTFLIMGGIGIDTMRHEMVRAKLQATLDRAVLAGATASTAKGARDVIEDYFAKSGMADYLLAEQEGDIDVTLNSAKVSANAKMSLDTYLMKMSGIKTITTAASSTAAVTIPKLEIVLALDVSGSMQGERLTKLKSAAKEFVGSILDSSEAGKSVISIVPFSTSVTPPKEVFEALTVDKRHNYSTCLYFTEDEYGKTSVDPDETYAQMIYTSRQFNSSSAGFNQMTDGDIGDATTNNYNRSCLTDEAFQILPYSISKKDLEDKIDGLIAAGSTSADLGMKWAAALLDPDFDQVVTHLQSVTKQVPDGTGGTKDVSLVDAGLTNHPAAYTTTDSLKVIVLMGDGANHWTAMLDDPNKLLDPKVAESHSESDYRGPDSNLYKVEYTDQVFKYAFKKYDPSITSSNSWYCNYSSWDCKYESVDKVNYYVYSNRWNDYTDVQQANTYLSPSQFGDLKNTIDGYKDTIRLDWEEAWGLMTPELFRRMTDDNVPDQQFDITSLASASNSTLPGIKPGDKDRRMGKICDAAKTDDHMIVFTIAFEMGNEDSAAGKLQSCATSETHHYNATTVNIKSAFSAIASNVKHLRLTQ